MCTCVGARFKIPWMTRSRRSEPQDTSFGALEREVLSAIARHPDCAPRAGVIHVGSHRQEERHFYATGLNVDPDRILWVDANESLCAQHPGTVNAVLADVVGKEVDFIVTNNDGMSSSILELGLHASEYPECVETSRSRKTTTTLDVLVNDTLKMRSDAFDYLAMDVQGAELLVLTGAEEVLCHVNMVVTEISIVELYVGCCLLSDITDFLGKRGFVRESVVMETPTWGNAVFVRAFE